MVDFTVQFDTMESYYNISKLLFSMSEQNADMIYIDEIARALKEKRAAIMVGSGFSKNASPDFPNWRELGNKIFERLHNRKPEDKDRQYLNLLRLAGELESIHGRTVLDAVIRKSIPDTKEPSEVHKELLDLPWTDVFTTNYDTLLEQASKRRTEKYDVIISKEDLVYCSSQRIVKLHGSLPSQRPFVITEEDYRQYPKTNAVFVNTVQQSLIENLFCLIGFSGDDPNFLNWIGWVRDNLGSEYTGKIYLLSVADEVSLPQRSLLLRRNIITIDLRQLYGNASSSPQEIFKQFFATLEKRIENQKKRWNITHTLLPNQQGVFDAECQKVVNKWKQIRESYPGWVVLPYQERSYPWTLAQQWGSLFHSGRLSELSTALQYEFTYEIIWRINKCLFPIDNVVIESCDIMINDSEWKNKEYIKWFEIILTLLREYRTTRNEPKWNELAEIVQNEQTRLSPEQWSAFCYEKSLKTLFSVNTEKLRKSLDDWAEVKNAPLLEAKKAALWAELGEFERAKEIVCNALETVRTQLNTAPTDKQIIFLSQEGCILSIYHCIELSDAYARGEFNIQMISEKFRDRLDTLRQQRCDITEEQVVFSTALKHEPTPPPEAITKRNSFDIGTANYNTRWSNDGDNEMLLGYSYLIFAEETGAPFKLANSNFSKDSAVGAAKRIKAYCFHWAFITLLRTGDIKEVDTFFDREDMSILKQEDADYYVDLCIESLGGMQKDIAGLDNPHIAKNLAANYAEIIPEILSRLCTKCSTDALHKILDYLVKIYNLSEKDKQAFRGVDKLVKRFIMVYPVSNSRFVFDALKKVAYQPDNWLESVCGFIDPYLPFVNRISKDFKPTVEDIEFALTLLETHRRQGMSLCFAFRQSLNHEQKQRYAALLWDEKYLDAKTGFPQSDVFLNSVFIDIPAPDGVNVLERFKTYSMENIKDKDIFGNTAGSAQSAGEQSIAMTGGWSWMATEWEVGYGIFSAKNIELNADETQILYDYVRSYWEKSKHNLIESSTPYFSISGEFHSRFQTLLRVLAVVVIPNAIKNNTETIKGDIDKLLMEMGSSGLNVGLVKIVSLVLFPDRQADIQRYAQQVFSRFSKLEVESVLKGFHILLVMKHVGIAFVLDTQWAVGCIAEHIKNWLSPVLDSAMFYLTDIVITTPQFIEDRIISDILPALDILTKETDLRNRKSRIVQSNRLACRKACMGLASSIAKYYESKNVALPTEVQKWQSIATSSDEFWEIRNEWKHDLTR